MKTVFQSLRRHLPAVVFFVVLACVYFAPAVFQDKSLGMGDIQKWEGMAKELSDYAQTPESEDFPVLSWTGSMFSGMPSYTVTNQKVPANYLTWLETPFRWLTGGADIVLLALVCFYILMGVMGVRGWPAVAGAVAFAFASYNIIILEAGHVTKAYAIAYMPLTLAGMLLVCRERWLAGGVLTVLGVAFSIKSSHIQITYYLALLCVVLFAGYAVERLRQRDYRRLLRVTGVLTVCVALAVLANAGTLYSNYEMSRESIRGASELTEDTTGSEEKASSGLDIDYAFAWSYGKAETMTLLIPDFHGGSSGGNLPADSSVGRAMKAHGLRTGHEVQAPTYWGDQPFTSGPVYFGALVCFLFVLGMMVVKHPIKWWVLGATVFFVLLSWGRHFMPFNEFLFHYLPLYNKFRTVSMALVIPGLTFPLIGVWGLKVIFAQEVDRHRALRALGRAAGLTGGLCLVFWIMPGVFFDFRSAADAQYGLPGWYLDALAADREALLRHDALRSLLFIGAGAALLWFYLRRGDDRRRAAWVGAGLMVLVLVDLWGVALRYVDYDSFTKQKPAAVYKQTEADRYILQDTDPSYRVLNLNNPFNETNTSYYHKSIGGYNAAKLRRYQELIDYRLTDEIDRVVDGFRSVQTYADLQDMPAFRHTPTLNMLNTRYVVFNPEQPPAVNTQAYGNAWFVSECVLVDDADAEMAAMQHIDPRKTAVVDRRFADLVHKRELHKDAAGSIELVSYEPVRLRYRSKAAAEQLAVFSEIYYPHGWEATIDGRPVEHFRADWTLRAMYIPAGEHDIEFRFMPRGYIAASRVASVTSLLVLLLALFVAGRQLFALKKAGGEV